MKLHWFHLASWQNLPPDFTERYRSVWVDVPSELYDPVDGHRHYKLHRVTADTLLIWGAEDRVVPPSYAERFAGLMPNARTVILPDLGHFPMLERPAEFVEAVRSLLEV